MHTHSCTIALVADHTRMTDLAAWVWSNRSMLSMHEICAPAATAVRLQRETGVDVRKLRRGEVVEWSVGRVEERRPPVDFLLYFWSHPAAAVESPDETALLRVATTWNIPVAWNRATADVIIASSLLAAGRA
ncbi:MAG: methylglyoxal synthase [Mycobacterium sp.]